MTYRAVAELERALLDCRPVQIQLPRGSGKTTLASIAVLYLLSTAAAGRRAVGARNRGAYKIVDGFTQNQVAPSSVETQAEDQIGAA